MHFDLVKNNMAALNNERLAKIWNLGNVKQQNAVCGLRFAVCGLRFPMKNLMLEVSIGSYLNLSTAATVAKACPQLPINLSTTISFFISDWWKSQEWSWNLTFMARWLLITAWNRSIFDCVPLYCCSQHKLSTVIVLIANC